MSSIDHNLMRDLRGRWQLAARRLDALRDQLGIRPRLSHRAPIYVTSKCARDAVEHYLDGIDTVVHLLGPVSGFPLFNSLDHTASHKVNKHDHRH